MASAVIGGVGCLLGHGHVPGGGDETSELPDRYGVIVHPETGDVDGMRGPLLRVEIIRTHGKGAAGNPRHAFRRSRFIH